ncbi:MAG: acetate/propionate family kinase, partial [Vulcanimicrobiaceae bacterium]
MGKPIVVLNCGSSSIKFALFDGQDQPLPRKPVWAGQVEGIGGDRPVLHTSDGRRVALELGKEAPYGIALRQVRL